MKTAFVALMAGSLLLAGCGSLLPKPAPLPALHDFGVPAQSAPSAVAFRVTAEVSAPAWLQGTEIYYRLAYANATRVRAYADNRWLAPPAELLQTRLQAAFGNVTRDAPQPVAAYRLKLRVLDLEQVFTAPQSARIELHAVAELQSLASGASVAQREFSITAPAAADVNGAVQGVAQAADALVADLLQWVGASARAHAASQGGSPPQH